MKKIRSFEIEQIETDKYKIMMTFQYEEEERDFIKMLFESLNNEYVVSTFIQDLESDIELYKQYFIDSNITIIEKGLMHPIIVCQELKPNDALNVIGNFGYYTIDAYLYWSKTIINVNAFTKKMKKENFLMNYSDLAIRQVLDLSLSIRISSLLLNVFLRLLVNWTNLDLTNVNKVDSK